MNRRDFAALTAIPKAPKKTARILRAHTCRRLHERYRLSLSRGEVCDLERDVRIGKATFVARESGNRSCFRVRAHGQDLYFIYDNKRSAFATCLTREMVAHNFPGVTLPPASNQNEGEIL